MKYLISSCLIGDNCKYNGGNNFDKIAKALFDKGLAISVCPEVLGGLDTPRVPAEIVKDKVINKEGIDVTIEYIKGADSTLKTALDNDIKIAILQARSPSCGSKEIYDGTFSGKLIKGEGRTTKLLRESNIKVITIDDYIRDYYEKDFK
ncbi:hypothetical protein KQ51_00664 [Candidatus Izimaplasma bacterium HR1]|jgi:uncharacterized protein YbbK (DUF523 family)|uniref:DUF523 domain-containing protein n=1 Tax=Candidatus Izimoplasma sp. HR1 TaxID=1541959 RepID=UPI0004F58E26|nr:hypothetical protein KQ51_00664 [Candidatus Izimaplasma bacterium HR1]